MIAPYYVLHMLNHGNSPSSDPINDVPLILVIYGLGVLLLFVYMCAKEYNLFSIVCFMSWNALCVTYIIIACTFVNIWFDTKEYKVPLNQLNVYEQTSGDIYLKEDITKHGYFYAFCIKDENDESQLVKASSQRSKVFEEENCESPHVIIDVESPKPIPILNPFYGRETVNLYEFHVPKGTVVYASNSNRNCKDAHSCD